MGMGRDSLRKSRLDELSPVWEARDCCEKSVVPGLPHMLQLLSRSGLRPERPVQRSILNRLGNMLRFKLRSAIHVGDRTRDFKDAIMGARTEALLSHGAFQQAFAISRELPEFANEGR